MNDIYTTPKSNLVDGNTPVDPGRSGWVWAIFLLHAIALISTIASYYLLLSDALPLPAEQKQYIENLGRLNWSMNAIGTLLSFSAALTLFMLRKITVWLWLATLIYSIIAILYRLQGTHFLQFMQTFASIGVMIGISLKVAIYLYARHLASRGILK